MKKIIGITALAALALSSCGDDSNWSDYEEWRNLNTSLVEEAQNKKNEDGTPFYSVLVPDWDPAHFILIHYFNDREETAGNLSPLYTSTGSFRYELHIYPDSLVDASANNSANGILDFRINQVVPGFSAAAMDMHCGDTCEVIIPYSLGYGYSGSGLVPPYTTLKFNMRLVDIPDYEQSPY
ncbi:MAG: FKBP-type peptidyl-prolyl cis-trans isomerase [Muribaculaceae bacterium]|nr:FKBP-type peptidyl-prolyl cis-trans isomerase [Muribaculaceae bacterium]